jgi:hypothetical protein
MYKSTADAGTFRERVASDSTKGYATGKVDVLPPEARPWEELYSSLREQIEVATRKYFEIGERMEKLALQSLDTMPYKQYQHLALARHRLGQQHHHYQELIGQLNRDARQAVSNGLGGCFIAVAQRMLTDEQYVALMAAAKELSLGHAIDEPVPKLDSARPTILTENQKEKLEKTARQALRPNDPAVLKDKAKLAQWRNQQPRSTMTGGGRW